MTRALTNSCMLPGPLPLLPAALVYLASPRVPRLIRNLLGLFSRGLAFHPPLKRTRTTAS